MANLVYLICLTLIVATVQVSGGKQIFRPLSGYFCKPSLRGIPYSKLDAFIESNPKLFDGSPKEVVLRVYETLTKPEYSQDTYRGIPVAELLALKDVTEAKCNLAELEKMHKYREMSRPDPMNTSSVSVVTSFVKNYKGEQQRICAVENGRLYKEAEATAKNDQSIPDKIASLGKLKGKTLEAETLTSSLVLKAAERYIKSEPGRKDFVLAAKRLHIFYACEHLALLRRLVWRPKLPDALDKLLDGTDICEVYLDEYPNYAKKLQVKVTKGTKLSRAAKKTFNVIMEPYFAWNRNLGSTGGGAEAIIYLLITSPFWIPLLPAMVTGSVMYISYVLGRAIYEHSKTVRDPGAGRYRIYEI